MRRFAASLFLFVYLFANTELHQLAKVSAFMEHFKEHKLENPDMTLVSFVILHYFSGNLKDADYAQDMKLPFKDTDCSSWSPSHTLPFPDPFVLSLLVSMEFNGLTIYDQSALPSLHLSDIWQPPKTC